MMMRGGPSDLLRCIGLGGKELRTTGAHLALDRLGWGDSDDSSGFGKVPHAQLPKVDGHHLTSRLRSVRIGMETAQNMPKCMLRVAEPMTHDHLGVCPQSVVVCGLFQ